MLQVDYEGNVTLLTQAIYMSKCSIGQSVQVAELLVTPPTPDVTYYPFDAQLCELKFASWTTEVTRVSNEATKVSNEVTRVSNKVPRFSNEVTKVSNEAEFLKRTNTRTLVWAKISIIFTKF